MEVFAHEERTLTVLDHTRLLELVPDDRRRLDPRLADPVEELLDNAALVPSRDIPPDVVTMRSKVVLQDLATSDTHALTLGYPGDARAGEGIVSVLSPAGASLLGLRVGSVARWTAPDGREHAAQVIAIHFQPEASGDYTL
ncbi:GreA/GreB family elongation factor [Azohydromonas caseinilytica]|uniref:Transcription elongation factor GreAB n=1 Tax=Azohydromonas caseinilytica TaxID=2728836 RepID=A0A848FES7_9BURK|nr:GreA/GreB family elongation factor [Azohydromonas caseinilytica]NML16849.1 transcription elongation factor GreAB [Azohydromonas caseinilytica]